ncbi:D-alanine--poly(phosphoribitol) ligase subunit DltA [Lacticaseibacillus saniviri]|uniref:D-alanine--D-alanyl carrier protein ligase n=1 Tax=Lacticaseibacillus saniviri JCM 17471 = DSM 24301 TaxID=1293598 RepID=A0A0R2MWF5_9LACO|nr:D-alanine--poly(phosphoribitol) ligase subunit DltA [Lacticaseibacillus saniviri]KRO17960.1 D-alanine-activating enzyme [Lacticaseibacillus saniviri JCM 17471 = DSM 24301]MCG4282527.1 D-alanine--poly(phosphoribitol) ligase subunit DltA [Lacticaseibacillus saniviri]
MVDNIIHAIDQVATDQPNQIAYVYGDNQYTYATLKADSDRLANFFSQVLPEKAPIIVYGGQTFEMITTFLGLSKSGHAYIPIDTHSPSERITQVQEVAGSPAIIAVEPLPIEVPDVQIIDAALLQEAVKTGNPNYDASKQVKGDDNYYIIFTSGTTGFPKGVQISHSNLLSYVNWNVDDFGLKPGVVAMSQPPYSFDLSVMDLYPTLVLGGTLKAIPKQVTDNFKRLFEVLPELGLNEWVSTPSFVEIALLDPNFDQAHYPDLSHFLFCGEELTNKTAVALNTRFPNAAVYNTYGPTEATVAVTGMQITSEITAKYDRLPIGYAKADTTVYVVDEAGKKVAPGVEGELMIVGPSVSKGYLNNPEKTTKAFFDADGHAGYRTGDLVTMDEDGLVFYRGRTDFQVKLHGYRIELEDIDHNLAQVKEVKQATTVPRYDKEHKVTQLIAYVVPQTSPVDNAMALTKTIKAELGELVMEYMIPQRIVYRDALPLTANGKVDRKALIAEVNPHA